MSEEQTAVEEQARAQGWVPVEEFRGGPEKHKSAEDFIAFGKRSQAVQKERNDKLLNEITSLKTQVGSYQETMNSFKAAHDTKILATEKEAYDRALKDLKAEKKQAVSEADVDAVEAVDEKISNLKKPEKPEEVKTEKAPVVNQEYVAWVAANPWFEEDQTMREYAEFIGDKISKDGKTTPEKFYETINERVKAQFPAKFPGQQEETQDVEASTTGGNTQSSSKGKTYKDLPADAKAACDKGIKAGTFKNKEAYVALYPF